MVASRLARKAWQGSQSHVLKPALLESITQPRAAKMTAGSVAAVLIVSHILAKKQIAANNLKLGLKPTQNENRLGDASGRVVTQDPVAHEGHRFTR